MPKNTIAFQGRPGAHSDVACRIAHPYMDTIPCPSFEDVFEKVASGEAELGLVPIENSQAGRVAELHALLPTTNLHFIGEYLHKVQHHLLAPKGAKLEDVKTVYSHPQALMQCRENLVKLGVTREAYPDTAGAAEMVAQLGDKSKGAIASALAAELYGLEIVQKDMQDRDDNTTLFVTISKEEVDPDPEKERVLTTLLFSVRNIPAALYKALGGFATNGVNMLKLESYIASTDGGVAQFFVTFEGHPQQKNVKQALEEIGFYCRGIKVLGVYPADIARFV